MKKLIYACLLALVAVSLGCEKEDLSIENKTDSQVLNPDSKNLEKVNAFDIEKVETKNSRDLNQQTQGRGFGGDGSDGNNQIYDGTNFHSGPPNGFHWTILVTYTPGITEQQKQEFRVQYQVTGELYYFEQCLNDPQKELWYFIPEGSDVPCFAPLGFNCQRSSNPPQSPPSGMAIFAVNQTCDD